MGLMDRIDIHTALSLNNNQTHVVDLTTNHHKDPSKLEITRDKVVFVDRNGVGHLMREEMVEALLHLLATQDALHHTNEGEPPLSATARMLHYMYDITGAAMAEQAAAQDKAQNPPKGEKRRRETEDATYTALLNVLCEATVRLEDIAAGRELTSGTASAVKSLKTRLAIRNDRKRESKT